MNASSHSREECDPQAGARAFCAGGADEGVCSGARNNVNARDQPPVFVPAAALDQPIRASWRTITAAPSSLSPFALHVYPSSPRLR
jgi:hypothetical protein